MERCLLVRQSP